MPEDLGRGGPRRSWNGEGGDVEWMGYDMLRSQPKRQKLHEIIWNAHFSSWVLCAARFCLCFSEARRPVLRGQHGTTNDKVRGIRDDNIYQRVRGAAITNAPTKAPSGVGAALMRRLNHLSLFEFCAFLAEAAARAWTLIHTRRKGAHTQKTGKKCTNVVN